MGRPRKPAVADFPAEEESQENPDNDFLTPEQSIAAAEQEGFALNGTPSKAAIVREAMAAGLDSPGDIADFALTTYKVTIAKPQVSAYKAQAKAKGRGGDSEPRTRTQSPAQHTGIPAGFSSDVKELRALIETAGGSDELKELIGQLSGLLGKYGAGGLTELIDAIG